MKLLALFLFAVLQPSNVAAVHPFSKEAMEDLLAHLTLSNQGAKTNPVWRLYDAARGDPETRRELSGCPSALDVRNTDLSFDFAAADEVDVDNGERKAVDAGEVLNRGWYTVCVKENCKCGAIQMLYGPGGERAMAKTWPTPMYYSPKAYTPLGHATFLPSDIKVDIQHAWQSARDTNVLGGHGIGATLSVQALGWFGGKAKLVYTVMPQQEAGRTVCVDATTIKPGEKCKGLPLMDTPVDPHLPIPTPTLSKQGVPNFNLFSLKMFENLQEYLLLHTKVGIKANPNSPWKEYDRVAKASINAPTFDPIVNTWKQSDLTIFKYNKCPQVDKLQNSDISFWLASGHAHDWSKIHGGASSPIPEEHDPNHPKHARWTGDYKFFSEPGEVDAVTYKFCIKQCRCGSFTFANRVTKANNGGKSAATEWEPIPVYRPPSSIQPFGATWTAADASRLGFYDALRAAQFKSGLNTFHQVELGRFYTEPQANIYAQDVPSGVRYMFGDDMMKGLGNKAVCVSRKDKTITVTPHCKGVPWGTPVPAGDKAYAKAHPKEYPEFKP